jgi:predicted Holliday junction resolvase-like endonuclease
MILILLIILIILILYVNNKLNLISQIKQKTSENNRYIIAPLNDKYIKSTSIPQIDNKPFFNMLFEETSPWSESKGIKN